MPKTEQDVLVREFATLFAGRTEAYGTGKGRWVKEPLTEEVYARHLRGEGDGLGIAPLQDDGTVMFAAIDLDEPNFELAERMQRFIPGPSFVERTRSGNAHIWVFFSSPAPAWIVRGILRTVTSAVGRPEVEVFPKQDKLRPGMLGNYINLSYFGSTRPILDLPGTGAELSLADFVVAASEDRIDPQKWIRRADLLGIQTPRPPSGDSAAFGESPILHPCATYIIEGVMSGERPIEPGSRNIVFFNLAKMLLHYEGFTSETAAAMIHKLNDVNKKPLAKADIQAIIDNVLRNEYKSTGCDGPEMDPYVRNDCPFVS